VSPRERVRILVESNRFQQTIIGVILLNAATLGLETSDRLTQSIGGALHTLDRIALAIFVGELLLRLYAHGLRLFRDPWGVFDLGVVALALLPATGALSVLRSLRIIRMLRLVSAVPGMRRVVSGLLSAIPAMSSIIFLLGLVLYIGAVMATEMYGATAPQHFGHLGRSLFTLFQVMTGEAWPDIAADVLPHHPGAWLFFVLFILVCTFVILNLFTAVVVTAMEPDPHPNTILVTEIQALRAELAALRPPTPTTTPNTPRSCTCE
jgi:voltage-gated sodium channel